MRFDFLHRTDYGVEYDNGKDVREEIFSLFAESGMPILSMADERMGLSEFYLKLCESEREDENK